MREKYVHAIDFEADVRLIFSKAVSSYNKVDKLAAKELITVFDGLWEPVKARMDPKTKTSCYGKRKYDKEERNSVDLSSFQIRYKGATSSSDYSTIYILSSP